MPVSKHHTKKLSNSARVKRNRKSQHNEKRVWKAEEKKKADEKK